MMAGGSWLLSPKAARANDLDVAWQDRLADAKALLTASRPAAAIAAGLYALEIRLKVIVCHRLDLDYLPTAVQFHHLGELLVLAGLSQQIEDPALDPVRSNWNQIRTFADQLDDLRYKPDSGWSMAQASALMTWLEDPAAGVLSWLSALP